jgi:hypothetical protein
LFQSLDVGLELLDRLRAEFAVLVGGAQVDL